jgi:hypothetical protein
MLSAAPIGIVSMGEAVSCPASPLHPGDGTEYAAASGAMAETPGVNPVRFLLSAAASYITGQRLGINGGATIGF